jgi:hypothetical protein
MKTIKGTLREIRAELANLHFGRINCWREMALELTPQLDSLGFKRKYGENKWQLE